MEAFGGKDSGIFVYKSTISNQIRLLGCNMV